MSEFEDGIRCGMRVAALAAETMAGGIVCGRHTMVDAAAALRALAKFLREGDPAPRAPVDG